MTASDYTHFTLHQQRERALATRNERRRVTLEHLDESSPECNPHDTVRRSLRTRLDALVTRVPARG